MEKTKGGAVDIFVGLELVKCELQNDRHKGEIDVLSYSGTSQST
jgi:hypothetical protein